MSARLISVFFNNRGEIIDCNPEAVRAFGFSSKSELRTALAENPENYFFEASPNSAEISLFKQVEMVFSDGDREFEAEIAAKDRRIPVSVIMKRIIFEDTTCVIAYMIDLSDLKQANLKILRHTQLFEAVNNVATTLLKNKQQDMSRVLQRSLKILGETVNADQVSIWRNYINEEGKLCGMRLPAWVQDSSIGDDKPGAIVDYATYLPSWDNTDHAPHRTDINRP